MKPLPVVQPSTTSAPAQSGPFQTAAMLNDREKSAALTPRIIDALSTVFDPDIPVNIYELGLIYEVIVDASGAGGIRMTLTAPACPAAQCLPGQVRDKVAAMSDVTDVKVDVVWDPPRDRNRMSGAATLQLGMF
jgi:FeS assembly SUF system protein